jgi:hypothetical protein
MIKVLVVYGHVDEAKSIQKQFASVMEQLKGGMDEIFVPLQLQYPPNEEGVVPAPTIIEKPTIAAIQWMLEILS